MYHFLTSVAGGACRAVVYTVSYTVPRDLGIVTPEATAAQLFAVGLGCGLASTVTGSIGNIFASWCILCIF